MNSKLSTKVLTENDRSDTALLLIDIINDLDFEGNEAIIESLPALIENLSRLKKNVQNKCIPVIYVNDNFNMWRSNLNDLLDHCLRDDAPGKSLVQSMKPGEKDYFVLKPMHSGFYGTPLDILLKKLGVKNLVLAGLAADICVLYTANDAYMHGFEITIVSDCIMSNTAEEKKNAIEHMRKRLKAKIVKSTEIDNELGLLVRAEKDRV